MEAVGAAATIIGLVQTGLSLAKALNTYAGTVHDSNDDIAIIADDIYATYRHLNDLDLVLKKNEKASILTDDALESAQKCIRQAEILIRKLKKLLIKGYGNDNVAEVVESTQIDISKFKKGIWYIYKSEFELRRSELAQIKADISLIYLTYLALSANTTTERKQAQDEMELVYNRKIVLSRHVQKARERRDRDVEEGAVDENDEDDGATEPGGTYDIPTELEDTAIVYDNVEALYQEFENWLVQREQKAAALAAERKQLEDEAIARHENELKEQATKAKTEAQKLRETLLQHGVPPQRALEITRDVFPSSVEASGGDKELHLGKDIDTGKADSGPLLDPLRDLNEPGGIAQLKAFYLQRVHISPARSEIMKLEVAVSGQQLIQNRGVGTKYGSTSEPDASQGFGNISEDYILQIKQELEALQTDTGQTWILLDAKPVKKMADNGKSRLGRRKKTEEVVGVQIVVRKVSGKGLWQLEEVQAQPISVQTRVASPDTVMAPHFMSTSRMTRAANHEYYPQHASQIVPRSGTSATNRYTSSVRTRPNNRKGPRTYMESIDSSPERDVVERRTRFAPQTVTIPSPRYDASMSDVSRSRQDSRMEERVYGRNAARKRPGFLSRQDSTASADGDYYQTNRRRTVYWNSDDESESETMLKNKSDTHYIGPQTTTTSYPISRRRIQRTATLGRPRVDVRTTSMNLSDDEAEETILKASPELPSNAAVHSILERWGTQTDRPVAETQDLGRDEQLPDSIEASQAGFHGSKETSRIANGVPVSFESTSNDVNGSV